MPFSGLNLLVYLGYSHIMQRNHNQLFDGQAMVLKPSPLTRHAELLRLCARIGYSPPLSA